MAVEGGLPVALCGFLNSAWIKGTVEDKNTSLSRTLNIC